MAAPAVVTVYGFGKLGNLTNRFEKHVRNVRSNDNSRAVGELHKNPDMIGVEEFLSTYARGQYSSMVDFYQQDRIYPVTEKLFESYRNGEIKKLELLHRLKLTDDLELAQAVGLEYYFALELCHNGSAKNIDEAKIEAVKLLNEMNKFTPEQKKIMDRLQSDPDIFEKFKERLKERMISQNKNMSMSINRKTILGGNYKRGTILGGEFS